MHMLFELFHERSAAPTINEHAAEVIKQQKRYWAKLHLNVCLHASIVFFAIGVPLVALEIVRFAIASTTHQEILHVGFALSGSMALAAFAVLATLIVAVQISVRTPAPGDDQHAADARQIILETLARLCGAGAVAVGVGASLSHLPSLTFVDSVRFLGPLAGAYLLALFAADAASASNARLGKAINDENKRLFIEILENAADRISDSTRPQSWKGNVVQLVAVLVLAPAGLVALIFLLWGEYAPGWLDFALDVGYFSAYTVLATTALVLARNQWARADWIGAVYWVGLFTLSLGAVAVMAWLVLPSIVVTDARTATGRALLSAGLAAVWYTMCATLAWRVPFSKRRGVGAAVLIRLLRRTAAKEKRDDAFSFSWRTLGVLVLCVVLPPVGIYFAYRLRAQADAVSPEAAASGSQGTALLRTGYAVMFAWIAVIVLFFAFNPSVG